ncbi:MAG: CotH kinase family protein [Eggerthellaceae bacterium]|nr:CotH kinase family protein [Eggerthellaceae bacterium]
MITSKYLPAITAVLVCLCLVAAGFSHYSASASVGSASPAASISADTLAAPAATSASLSLAPTSTSTSTKTMEYEKRLFGDTIISLEIQVDKGDWQSLLNRASSKEWIAADLVINGELFSTVGVRTKGNSSLSQVVQSNSDRYSLQIQFNKYVKGQTYYGLDTFCINNIMGDATYMKDYLSYEIMRFIGVEAPLTNFANVTVNGEHYGFFIAIERYDKAYLGRVNDSLSGQLYNVKIQMGQRENFEGMWQDVENRQPGQQGNRAPGGGGGMNFGGSGGGSLIYTDNKISSYSAIFSNAVFSSATEKDMQRVITAIENLNVGTDLEKYFDVDAILRYFAAHTVVVNLDSYSSNMQQNYYIYERDGKISILPWDYNLAFGGFQSGDASSVVNFPIDTPVSGVSMEERPLLNKLLEVDEYRERYHEYLRIIVEEYFESGLFEKTIYELDAKINEYVRNDSTAFYSYTQYQNSLPVLVELGRLRALSIRGQLEGTIPSTSSGQNANRAALVDASSVNLSALGSMMGGGGGMGAGGGGQLPGQGNPGQGGQWPGQGGFPGR